MKKTWRAMKEMLGKMHQHNKSELPLKITVDKKYIALVTEIAKRFDEFFTNISPYLARKLLL